jgi:hypothetical protein
VIWQPAKLRAQEDPEEDDHEADDGRLDEAAAGGVAGPELADAGGCPAGALEQRGRPRGLRHVLNSRPWRSWS